MDIVYFNGTKEDILLYESLLSKNARLMYPYAKCASDQLYRGLVSSYYNSINPDKYLVYECDLSLGENYVTSVRGVPDCVSKFCYTGKFAETKVDFNNPFYSKNKGVNFPLWLIPFADLSNKGCGVVQGYCLGKCMNLFIQPINNFSSDENLYSIVKNKLKITSLSLF